MLAESASRRPFRYARPGGRPPGTPGAGAPPPHPRPHTGFGSFVAPSPKLIFSAPWRVGVTFTGPSLTRFASHMAKILGPALRAPWRVGVIFISLPLTGFRSHVTTGPGPASAGRRVGGSLALSPRSGRSSYLQEIRGPVFFGRGGAVFALPRFSGGGSLGRWPRHVSTFLAPARSDQGSDKVMTRPGRGGCQRAVQVKATVVGAWSERGLPSSRRNSDAGVA